MSEHCCKLRTVSADETESFFITKKLICEVTSERSTLIPSRIIVKKCDGEQLEFVKKCNGDLSIVKQSAT